MPAVIIATSDTMEIVSRILPPKPMLHPDSYHRAMARAGILIGSLLLLGAGPSKTQSALEAVIWASPASVDDADAAVGDWKKAVESADGISLSDGFPRVFDSGKLAGLKPGFHAVVLGFCAKQDVDLVLPGLRRLKADIYAKPAGDASTPASCPKVTWTKCDDSCPEICEAAQRMTDVSNALASKDSGTLRDLLPPEGALQLHVVEAVGDVAEPYDRTTSVRRDEVGAESFKDVYLSRDQVECACDLSCRTYAGGYYGTYQWHRSGKRLFLQEIQISAH